MAKLTKNKKYIVDMYVRYFGKAPSVAEIAKYNALGKQKLISQKISGEFNDSKTGTTEEFVNSAFQNLFGRDADEKEMNKYSKVVDADKDLPINAIVKSAKKVDKSVYEAKKAIAIMLAEKENTTNYNLDKITKDTYEVVYNPKTKKVLVDSIADLETKIDAIPDNGSTPNVPGKTFTLTNSATPDTIIGTDKNDTINGPSGTVKDDDIIIDQSTTDNDTANLVLTADYTPTNITKIENVNIDWDAYTTPNYDLDKVKGSKTVTLTSSKTGFLGNATVTNATDMTLVAGNGMVGDLTASGFKTGTVEATNSKKVVVNGTTTKADNASIVVNAGTSTTDVTVGTTNGFKSTTVNAGTAGTVKVTDAGNTTDTTNVTVNKSAVNLTVNNAGATTLTTGANNVVTMGGASVIGTELTVKGEGNATLVFAANALNGEKITNAKTSGDLIIKSADTDGEDISKVQATLVEFTAAQAAGATTVATGANLKYSATGAINVTIAGSSTTDTATAELTASQTSVTATGVETLNIKANATATSGTDLTIGTLTTGANKVVLTGTNDVALTSLVSTAGTVDATALAGDLTIAGTTSSVTIKGATGKNTITTTGAATDVSVVGQNSDDTVTANTVDTGSVTAILADGKNTVSATALTTGTLVVTGGSGIDTVTAGAALTTGVINLNLGDGANVINLDDAAGAGSRTVVTGGGDDTLTFTGGLDDANDILSWTAGAGTDTLVLADSGADLSKAKVTLSGVEVIKVKDTAGIAATISSSLLSGTSITVKANAHAGTTSNLVVKGASDTTTIDLSTVTIDKSITNAIDLVTINATANTASAVTITGTSTVDVITGGDKGDTIVAGNGADTITGGKGNDTIDITETVANQAVDTIKFIAAADNGQDTIIGFKSGTDKIDLVATETTVTTADTAPAVVDFFSAALTNGAAAYAIGAGSGTKTTNDADVVVISTTLSSKGDLDLSSTGTELLKALSSTDAAATGLTVNTASNKFYLVAYQDNKAYLYHADAGADTAVTADEIKLIGTFNDITAGTLVAADFIA